MMMMSLAEATAHVDVYIVASNNNGVGRPEPRRAEEGATPPTPPAVTSAD